MESISEKEFKLLSDTNYNYNSPKYGIINRDDCFITKVNFEDNNFIDYINNIQLIKEEGFPIKTGFDFENSRIVTKNGKFTWYSTWDKLKVFKYKYCQIGKPNYVIIFNTFAKL